MTEPQSPDGAISASITHVESGSRSASMVASVLIRDHRSVVHPEARVDGRPPDPALHPLRQLRLHAGEGHAEGSADPQGQVAERGDLILAAAQVQRGLLGGPGFGQAQPDGLGTVLDDVQAEHDEEQVIRMAPVLRKLKAVREAKFRTQRALAERSGVAQTTIVRLEAGGNAQFRTTLKLAEALGVEPQEAESTTC